MSDEADGEDRTEEPSEKRLREAREKGEVPRSRELSTAIVVLAGVCGLINTREAIGMHARNLMMLGIKYDRADLFNADHGSYVFIQAMLEALKMVGPVFALTLGAAVAAPALLGGLNFSAQALMPKFERLDPIAGIGRIFSTNGLVELAKSLLKVVLIGGVLCWYMMRSSTDMLAVGTGDVASAIARTMGVIGQSALVFSLALGFIGLVDAPWQKFSFNKKMRMTKQQIKDEHKESDGNPEMKGKVRQMQRELSQRKMIGEVPKADVIVVNPSHFAVALKYDDGAMGAPRVVAKGMDVIAAHIREIAGAHHIPLVEAAPLARALYHSCEVGRDIPASLYVAVAQILAYVYRLKHAVAMGEEKPDLPKPEVDPELLGPYRMTDE